MELSAVMQPQRSTLVGGCVRRRRVADPAHQRAAVRVGRPARRRAEAEGLEVTFLEGEAGDLPFPDGSLFGPAVAITAPRHSLLWRFPSAEHQVAFFASFHGPTTRALQALGPDRAGALRAELLEAARRFDVAEDDTLVLRLDYLEVVVRKPAWL